MRQVSIAEKNRQITREGKRHNLYAVEGTVSQMVTVWDNGVVRKELRRVCDVDMAHPFGWVAKLKKPRYKFSRLIAYREARARKQAAEQAAVAETSAAFRADALRAQRQIGTADFMKTFREVMSGRANPR